jgi:hypothetical protein
MFTACEKCSRQQRWALARPLAAAAAVDRQLSPLPPSDSYRRRHRAGPSSRWWGRRRRRSTAIAATAALVPPAAGGAAADRQLSPPLPRWSLQPLAKRDWLVCSPAQAHSPPSLGLVSKLNCLTPLSDQCATRLPRSTLRPVCNQVATLHSQTSVQPGCHAPLSDQCATRLPCSTLRPVCNQVATLHSQTSVQPGCPLHSQV